jgi:hypothetical protein
VFAPQELLVESDDYRTVVKAVLGRLRQARPRGRVTALAKHMRCHPTFFSQVTGGRANFSSEQGLAFCDFIELTADETEFFLDLLHRDRAADERTKAHYTARLERRRKESAELKSRWRNAQALTAEQQRSYFQSWTSQAVHMLCRLGRAPLTVDDGARQLGLQPATVARELDLLETLGLVHRAGAGFRTSDTFLHLEAGSELERPFHASWRIKVAAQLAEEGAARGFHYSAALTLSREALGTLQRLMVEHLDACRTVISGAADEELHLLAIDLCPLTK